MVARNNPIVRSWYGDKYTDQLPEYIDIPGYAGRYFVTQDGRVWHRMKTKPPYPLQGVLKNKKREYKLTMHGVTHVFSASKIMKLTYFSGIPDGYCLVHINGILEDNSVINLKPMPRKEVGKKHNKSKDQRVILKCDPETGEILDIYSSTREVEKKCYISRQTVSDACNKRNKKRPGIAPDGFLYKWESDKDYG